VILPALASGEAVLCDRFFDATSAYQGFSRGIDEARVEWLNGFAACGLSPDLTFLLDVDPEDGFARIRGRGGRPDRIESESAAFHGKVREGYLRLQKLHPERILGIDGSLSADKVFSIIREAVSARFGW
jgi:dTMP kinase